MKKKPEITELTRKNLQKAFWDLYTKQSIEKITVKDICSLAGYNRSTFYQYYTDAYDVLHTTEKQLLKEIDDFVLRFMEHAGDPNASIAIHAIFELFDRLHNYIPVLFSAHGDTDFTHKVSEYLKPIWLKYFVPTSNYTPGELDLLLEYYISGLLSMYQKWYINPQDVSVERIIQLTFQTLPDTRCFEGLDTELLK